MRHPALLLPAVFALSACTIHRELSAPPAHSQASPYAVQAMPAVRDSYCAEALGEAQDAAARAAVTGSRLDADRADRTAFYARRDCR